ncbi:MAG: hypothetical protein K2W85_03945 [Phycisphaerales bacterium]|nr:hypothetical protein [Phycisphaerales bacterium]
MHTRFSLAILATILHQGCASTASSPAPSPIPSGRTTTMLGDADDLDAAVEVGAGQAECVIVSASDVIDDTSAVLRARVRRFELKHISGQTAVLDLSTTEPKINARCTVFPLGNAKLEELILDRVRVRLSDLKGKEFAPIRE